MNAFAQRAFKVAPPWTPIYESVFLWPVLKFRRF